MCRCGWANITSPWKDRQERYSLHNSGRTLPRWTLKASNRFLSFAPAGWLLALTVAAYAGVVDNGFCLDDTGIVTNNRLVATASWGDLWTSSYWQGVTGDRGGLYRPLTLSLITLQRSLFGESPGPYHLVSLLLQAVAGISLAVAVRCLGSPPGVAWFAGALLCVHPAASEAVNAVVGTADQLAFIGGLTGAMLLIRSQTWGATMLAALLIAVAALAKESAAVFAVGALVALLRYDRRSLPLLCASASLVLPIVLRAAITGRLGPGGIGFLDNPLAFADVLTRCLNAPALVVRYLLLVIFPWPLSADYSYDALPVLVLSDPASWLPPLLLCVSSLAVLGVWLRRRPCATLWAAVTVAVLALVTHVAVPVGTIFAERLAYPLVAVVGLLAAGAFSELRHRHGVGTGWGIAAILLLLFVSLDRHRTSEWRDDGALFSSALRVPNRSARVHYGWGRWLQLGGDHEAAINAYEKALLIHPRYPDALHNRGAALLSLGRRLEALSSYIAAARARPAHVKALFAIAVLRETLEDPEASAAYAEVLRHQPHYVGAARGAARCLSRSGDEAAAREVLRRAFGAGAAAEWDRLPTQRPPAMGD